jgi:hypothetical protein|tara:strand:+ start:7088 stop:7510 length:423 start_codon:yes stop_codon:yes gene_type:complete
MTEMVIISEEQATALTSLGVTVKKCYAIPKTLVSIFSSLGKGTTRATPKRRKATKGPSVKAMKLGLNAEKLAEKISEASITGLAVKTIVGEMDPKYVYRRETLTTMLKNVGLTGGRLHWPLTELVHRGILVAAPRHSATR